MNKENKETKVAKKKVATSKTKAKARVGRPLSTIVVGGDFGFGNIKLSYTDSTEGKIKKMCLKSAIDPEVESELGDTIYIDGKPCSLTTRNKLSETGEKVKDNQYTKLNIWRGLFEISKATNFTVKNFVVGVGCSLDTYREKESLKAFRDNLLENRKNTVEYYWINPLTKKKEYKKVTLYIKDIIIQPETLSAVYNIKGFNPNMLNIVTDLGCLNSQIVKFQGAPDCDNAVCTDLGFDYIVKKIVSKCRAKKINVDSVTIENCINNIEECREDIKTEIEDYILNTFLKETLQKEMIKTGVDVSLAQPVFVGGTSLIFKDYILQVFPNALFPQDMLHANSLGIYERTKRAWERMQKTVSEGA